ncbi:MAG: ECF transporter S component [Bacteroidales bacterium]|nr:ECF transporter S component [Bacteroidales bacterium]
MQTTVKLHNPGYDRPVTYVMAALFVIGNIVLPQLAHLVPQGGVTWLPIYFFTLVGAYKYGWRTGLLTAVISPVVNSVFFGMPAEAALPAIILKSILLALAAGYAASRYGRATLGLLIAVVLSYQIIGTAGEWIMNGNFHAAAQDFRIGIPGMLLQIVGGWFVINKVRI